MIVFTLILVNQENEGKEKRKIIKV